MVTLESVVGIAAGICTASSLLPQVVKMVQEKKATDISIGMLLILLSGLVLWIWYGIIKKDWPIIITNCFSLGLNFTILGLRWWYKKKGGGKKE
ncbi:MAG: SemiSWEET transporter [Taibaiella sp.]|nr:SemiSWEET transporter [Taibaiella sp.]